MNFLIKMFTERGYNVNLRYGCDINANNCIENEQYLLIDNSKKICSIIYNKYYKKYAFDYFKYFHEGDFGAKNDTIESCRTYDYIDEKDIFNYVNNYLNKEEFKYIKKSLETANNIVNEKLKKYKIMLEQLGYEIIVARKYKNLDELLLISKNDTTIALYLEEDNIRISNVVYCDKYEKIDFISIDKVSEINSSLIEKYFFTPLNLI